MRKHIDFTQDLEGLTWDGKTPIEELAGAEFKRVGGLLDAGNLRFDYDQWKVFWHRHNARLATLPEIFKAIADKKIGPYEYGEEDMNGDGTGVRVLTGSWNYVGSQNGNSCTIIHQSTSVKEGIFVVELETAQSMSDFYSKYPGAMRFLLGENNRHREYQQILQDYFQNKVIVDTMRYNPKEDNCIITLGGNRVNGYIMLADQPDKDLSQSFKSYGVRL